MASKKLKELEAKLTLPQQKAAFLLVENDLRDGGDKKTQEQIADEVGVTYKTLWSWRKQNRNFIDYKNELADDFFAEYRSGVYGQLMKLINSNQPSVKAISLYLQRYGLLTQKTQIETVDNSSARSNEDLARELEELDDLLGD
ncbi:phBC6A51 family helix-turn-helix protein [Neobacillus niacini]|uniref:phBC6A51 family helix-turn-helix protein n=1 Tax=Neobacillus niacini TaxID=86668 RepID=UPI00285FC8E1|nr:phBC6A51 family helix-turn-helix protein [Neobacillus niacini]MDR7001573.1 transcriptional regulator with XRE-family HTH domain [Neobacillus niacini]